MMKRNKKKNLIEYFPKIKKLNTIFIIISWILAFVVGVLLVVYVNPFLGIICTIVIFLCLYIFFYLKYINQDLNKEFEVINKILTEEIDLEKYYHKIMYYNNENLVTQHQLFIETNLALYYIYQNKVNLAKEIYNRHRNDLKIKDGRYYVYTSNLLFCNILENNKDISKILYDELCNFKGKTPEKIAQTFKLNKTIYELKFNFKTDALDYLENLDEDNKLIEFEKKYFLSEYYIKNNQVSKAIDSLIYLTNQPYNIFQELAKESLSRFDATIENNK